MINQNELFNNLMDLVNDPASGFYYTDQVYTDHRIYRIFNYRLSSYQHWIKPGALYGRGTVYDVSSSDKPVLVSLCMPKFFNENENPTAVTTEELESIPLEDLVVCDKLDGSLITVFRSLKGDLVVKSKGSLFSEQAIAAAKLIEEDDALKQYISTVVTSLQPAVSMNFEYVAPDNLIVLRYPKPKLIELNRVNHQTGDVYYINTDLIVPFNTVGELKNQTGVEGAVIYLPINDARTAVKIKTHWYVSLHRVRDDINNPKRIAAAVLEEASDDMKSAFPEFKEHIEKIECVVIGTWNRIQVVLQGLDLIVQRELELGTSYKDIALKCKDLSSEVATAQNLDGFDSFLFNYCMGVMRNKPFDNTKLKEAVIDYCISQ